MHECAIHHVWLNSGQRYSSRVTLVTLGWPPGPMLCVFAFFSFKSDVCIVIVFLLLLPSKEQHKICIEIHLFIAYNSLGLNPFNWVTYKVLGDLPYGHI